MWVSNCHLNQPTDGLYRGNIPRELGSAYLPYGWGVIKELQQVTFIETDGKKIPIGDNAEANHRLMMRVPRSAIKCGKFLPGQLINMREGGIWSRCANAATFSGLNGARTRI